MELRFSFLRGKGFANLEEGSNRDVLRSSAPEDRLSPMPIVLRSRNLEEVDKEPGPCLGIRKDIKLFFHGKRRPSILAYCTVSVL